MNKIICPKCQAVLNPQNNVILSALKKDGEWGLILLSAKLGDYSVNNHESFVIAEGDAVKFYCPACHINLSDFAPNKHLAGIELIDVDKTKKTIFISSVAGENCTYEIVDSKIKSYGKDANKYRIDYQNLIDWV